MEILIKETGEVKSLNVINTKLGVDWASEFVGNNDTLNTCTIVDGQHTMSQADFEWWEKLVAEYLAAIIRLEESLAEKNINYFAIVTVMNYLMYKPVIEWADCINSKLDKIESR